MIVISIIKKRNSYNFKYMCQGLNKPPNIGDKLIPPVMKEILKSWVDSPLLLGPSIHSDNGS